MSTDARVEGVASPAPSTALDIGKLIDTKSERTVWVKYEPIPGFELLINFIPRNRLRSMVQKNTQYGWNPRTHTREEELNLEAFTEAFTDAVITDWRGLTMERLRTLVPLRGEADDVPDSTEIPYTKANARKILANAYDLDDFLRSRCVDLSLFQSATLEGELGNL